MVTFAGTLVPLSDEDAKMLSDNVNQILVENDDLGSLSVAIFVNNFRLCLLMFIPVVGAIFGMFVLFSTGVGLSALSMTQGIPVGIAFLSLMITPIFWIEFASYSLGMSESIWSFRRFTQKRWAYLAWTAIFIGMTAVLLAIGAVVEAWLLLMVGV
ncbi:MAG: stage II sporulation protein M [Candidatus Bathyarchaeota archaeon]|nr:stage II sporulation protein M [Candidatus Termiticorpusculum sp.]